MKINRKYIIYISAFILCIVIGFQAGTMIKKHRSNAEVVSDSLQQEDDTTTTKSGSISIETKEKEIKLVCDHKQQHGDKYSLKVHADNVPEKTVIQYAIDDLKMKSPNGQFNNIPGSQSGKYTVLALNSSDNKELARIEISGFSIIKSDTIPVERMTMGEFQSILLNQNDNTLLGGKNPKVSRNIIIRTQGLEEGERVPEDILAVREKIANGIWSSARVVSVGYDDNGKINSVVLKPIY